MSYWVKYPFWNCYLSCYCIHKQPDSSPHKITLFHTKEWKGDTQPQLSPLLSMMGEVQKIQQEQNRPCVVMCKLVNNLDKINYHI